jgi:hypothetical protein
MKRLSVLLLAGFVQAAAPPAFAQCALCRAAVESSAEGRAMAGKLNRAILLLLGAPLGVAGSVAAAMIRSRRRLTRELRAAGGMPSSDTSR